MYEHQDSTESHFLQISINFKLMYLRNHIIRSCLGNPFITGPIYHTMSLCVFNKMFSNFAFAISFIYKISSATLKLLSFLKIYFKMSFNSRKLLIKGTSRVSALAWHPQHTATRLRSVYSQVVAPTPWSCEHLASALPKTSTGHAHLWWQQVLSYSIHLLCPSHASRSTANPG